MISLCINIPHMMTIRALKAFEINYSYLIFSFTFSGSFHEGDHSGRVIQPSMALSVVWLLCFHLYHNLLCTIQIQKEGEKKMTAVVFSVCRNAFDSWGRSCFHQVQFFNKIQFSFRITATLWQRVCSRCLSQRGWNCGAHFQLPALRHCGPEASQHAAAVSWAGLGSRGPCATVGMEDRAPQHSKPGCFLSKSTSCNCPWFASEPHTSS